MKSSRVESQGSIGLNEKKLTISGLTGRSVASQISDFAKKHKEQCLEVSEITISGCIDDSGLLLKLIREISPYVKSIAIIDSKINKISGDKDEKLCFLFLESLVFDGGTIECLKIDAPLKTIEFTHSSELLLTEFDVSGVSDFRILQKMEAIIDGNYFRKFLQDTNVNFICGGLERPLGCDEIVIDKKDADKCRDNSKVLEMVLKILAYNHGIICIKLSGFDFKPRQLQQIIQALRTASLVREIEINGLTKTIVESKLDDVNLAILSVVKQKDHVEKVRFIPIQDTTNRGPKIEIDIDSLFDQDHKAEFKFKMLAGVDVLKFYLLECSSTIPRQPASFIEEMIVHLISSTECENLSKSQKEKIIDYLFEKSDGIRDYHICQKLQLNNPFQPEVEKELAEYVKNKAKKIKFLKELEKEDKILQEVKERFLLDSTRLRSAEDYYMRVEFVAGMLPLNKDDRMFRRDIVLCNLHLGNLLKFISYDNFAEGKEPILKDLQLNALIAVSKFLTEIEQELSKRSSSDLSQSQIDNYMFFKNLLLAIAALGKLRNYAQGEAIASYNEIEKFFVKYARANIEANKLLNSKEVKNFLISFKGEVKAYKKTESSRAYYEEMDTVGHFLSTSVAPGVFVSEETLKRNIGLCLGYIKRHQGFLRQDFKDSEVPLLKDLQIQALELALDFLTKIGDKITPNDKRICEFFKELLIAIADLGNSQNNHQISDENRKKIDALYQEYYRKLPLAAEKLNSFLVEFKEAAQVSKGHSAIDYRFTTNFRDEAKKFVSVDKISNITSYYKKIKMVETVLSGDATNMTFKICGLFLVSCQNFLQQDFKDSMAPLLKDVQLKALAIALDFSVNIESDLDQKLIDNRIFLQKLLAVIISFGKSENDQQISDETYLEVENLCREYNRAGRLPGINGVERFLTDLQTEVRSNKQIKYIDSYYQQIEVTTKLLPSDANACEGFKTNVALCNLYIANCLKFLQEDSPYDKNSFLYRYQCCFLEYSLSFLTKIQDKLSSNETSANLSDEQIIVCKFFQELLEVVIELRDSINDKGEIEYVLYDKISKLPKKFDELRGLSEKELLPSNNLLLLDFVKEAEALLSPIFRTVVSDRTELYIVDPVADNPVAYNPVADASLNDLRDIDLGADPGDLVPSLMVKVSSSNIVATSNGKVLK